MAIRDDLLRQEDISEKDVDALLQSAHAMFEKEEQAQDRKSLEIDLEDIPLKFIDLALEELIKKSEKEAAAEQAYQRKRKKQANARRRTRVVLGLGTVVTIGLICTLVGYQGKSLVDERHSKVRSAERNVRDALEDHEIQERTFRKLTASSGETQSEIETLERNAKGAMKRIQMAITHEMAMREKLEEMISNPEDGLPPALSSKRVYMEMDLRKSKYRLITMKHELGLAEAKWREATETFSGWMAVTFGLTPSPEPVPLPD